MKPSVLIVTVLGVLYVVGVVWMYQHLKVDSSTQTADSQKHELLEGENKELKSELGNHQHLADEQYIRSLQDEVEQLKLQLKQMRAKHVQLKVECSRPLDPDEEKEEKEVVQHHGLPHQEEEDKE